MMRNYAILLLGLFIATGCNKKIDEISPLTKIDKDGELASAAGIVEATVGNYSMLRDNSTASYDEPVLNLSETRGNNVTLRTFGQIGKITDAFFYRNSNGPELGFSNDFYRGSYQLIVGVNTVLEGIEDFEKVYFPSASDDDKNAVIYAKGENHFLRALAYFNLVRLYGKPYYLGAAANKGVPIKKTSSLTDVPAPATVQEVYNFIITEAKLSAQLMKVPVVKANSFASKEAAWALLSRVYLYMGGSAAGPDASFNQAAITYADSALNQNDGKFALLQGEDYRKLFADDADGSIGRANFASNKEIIFAFDNSTGTTRIGIMFNYDPNVGQGGFFMPSSDLLQLYTPQDIRYSFFKLNSATGYRETTKLLVLFTQLFTHAPNIYFRTGELFLNEAEAYAKLGNYGQARLKLTVIHTRAGLPASDIAGIPDNQLLTAILKERRMELAFEGHAGYDYFRNGLPMIRKAADNNGKELIVQPTDPAAVLTLPNF
ncbi:RagB/SusD family nutrient uptake outer membrane protein [Chitinophaga sp. 22321]|uniref:RagB/SusD family nutrient uptake outer membrane protein n=1 Tax=Chitinophaga hostae TaxID=2831022 RepID=A0ABS5J5Z4_9BACT|nr:RagB/SusD family nutrient uptake outer membrane protein [Chitinophaga hostae]MBS0030490.1 RagB/SusD family nutrient uptake outer membrane protein [Chitinophaga hostae]